MARETVFTFRVNPDELEMIKFVAAHLKRTRSDAVRLIICQVAQKVNEQQQQPLLADVQNNFEDSHNA